MKTIDKDAMVNVLGGAGLFEFPGAEHMKQWVKPITNWGMGTITNIEHQVVNQVAPVAKSMVEYSKTPEGRIALGLIKRKVLHTR